MDDVPLSSDPIHAALDVTAAWHRPPRPGNQLAAAVSRLAPDGDVAELLGRAALPPASIEAARQVLTDPVAAWAIEETDRTVRAIQAYVPDAPDPPLTELARSTEAMLLQICRSLLDQPGTDEYVDECRVFGRDAALRGADMQLIVRMMRMVQQRWVGCILSALHGPPTSDDLQIVLTVTTRLFDEVVANFIGEYLGAREQLMAGQQAWRRRLVQALIHGSPVEPELIRSQLGIDIDRHHLAMILWFPGMGVGYELDRVAKQAAAEFPDSSLLSVPVEDGQMWAWLSCSTAPPIAASERLAMLRPLVPGVRLAVGPIAVGADGFRRSHLQALDTALTARNSTASITVSTWDRVGLLTLLGGDLERARWFVLAHLGPLSGQDAVAAQQRATLRSYLESNSSLVQTATALRVHRNTVVYRIGRIEEALGYPISERRTDLYCAVLLTDYFGSRVLGN